jgi:hypothetical protein
MTFFSDSSVGAGQPVVDLDEFPAAVVGADHHQDGGQLDHVGGQFALLLVAAQPYVLGVNRK